MRIVSLSIPAQADLSEAWWYIASASGDIATADVTIASLNEALQLLARFPKLGQPYFNPQKAGVRRFSVNGYFVLYHASSDEIEVARIMHHRRDRHDLLGQWLASR